jgi:hypothetical protein
MGGEPCMGIELSRAYTFPLCFLSVFLSFCSASFVQLVLIERERKKERREEGGFCRFHSFDYTCPLAG